MKWCKYLSVLKRIFLKCLIVILYVSMGSPWGWALNAPADFIDLELNQVPVSEAFRMLGEACGKNIIFKYDEVPLDTTSHNNTRQEARISMSVHQQTFDETLAQMLQETGLVSRKVGETLEIGNPSVFEQQQAEVSTWKKLEAQDAELTSHAFFVKFGNTQELLQVIHESGWLSARAKVAIDPSLNTLLVQGTSQDIDQVNKILGMLDMPPVQVLIEARIVEVDEQAMKAFGVSLLNAGVQHPSFNLSGQTATGVADPTGSLNLTLGQLPAGISLDLAIQALETQGNGQVVSAPNLLVSDGQSASIEQGAEVPYATESQQGNAQVQFKKAVMGLTVTPRVINNQEIFLNLVVNKDAVSSINLASAKNEPLINTQQIKTQVRVGDGQTVVLGGIIETNQDEKIRQVPVLGQLPGIGSLFRSKESLEKRKEIVIFVTPSIKREKKDRFKSTLS
jgi:type IV pilus assembly protein PilQ